MSGTEPFQTLRRTIGTFLFILAGPLIWALHLTFAYGPQSALCAFGEGTGNGYDTLAVATVAVVTLIAIVLAALAFVFDFTAYRLLAGVKPPDDQWPFLKSISRLLTGLSILAIVYAGVAVLFMAPCAQVR